MSIIDTEISFKKLLHQKYILTHAKQHVFFY